MNKDLAVKIHGEIIEELHNKSYDHFKKDSSGDQLLTAVINYQSEVSKQKSLRDLKFLGCTNRTGCSEKNSSTLENMIPADRYSSSYWKRWKNQYEMLESISATHLSTSSTSSKKSNGTSKRSRSKLTRVHDPKTKKAEDFTSVKYLYTVCAGEKLPPEYAPDVTKDRSAVITKTCLMAGGPARPPVPLVPTTQCEFPSASDLDRMRQRIQPVILPTSPRFPPVREAAPEPKPSHNPKPKIDGLDGAGSRFSRTQRFEVESGHHGTSSDTPGPGHYKVANPA